MSINNWWREPDLGGEREGCAASRMWRNACNTLVAPAADDAWQQIVEASPPDSVWHSLRNCVAYQAGVWHNLQLKGIGNVMQPAAFKLAIVLRHTPSELTVRLLADLLHQHPQSQDLTAYVLALLTDDEAWCGSCGSSAGMQGASDDEASGECTGGGDDGEDDDDEGGDSESDDDEGGDGEGDDGEEFEGEEDDGVGGVGAGGEGAEVEAVGVEGVGVEGAGVEDAGIEGAGVEDAAVDGVGVDGAGVEGAEVECVGIEVAVIEGAGIQDAVMEGAGVEDVVIEGAGFEDAVMEGVGVVDSVMEGAGVEDAAMEGAVIEGSGAGGAGAGDAAAGGAEAEGEVGVAEGSSVAGSGGVENVGAGSGGTGAGAGAAPLRDLQLFGDCELAVMAASREEYDAHAKLVRAEYANMTNNNYVELRIKVLNQFAAIPKLYHTEEFSCFEAAARENIEREICTLREHLLTGQHE